MREDTLDSTIKPPHLFIINIRCRGKSSAEEQRSESDRNQTTDSTPETHSVYNFPDDIDDDEITEYLSSRKKKMEATLRRLKDRLTRIDPRRTEMEPSQVVKNRPQYISVPRMKRTRDKMERSQSETFAKPFLTICDREGRESSRQDVYKFKNVPKHINKQYKRSNELLKSQV